MAWDSTGVWDLGGSGFCPCSDTSCLSELAPVEPVGDAGAEPLLPTQVKSQLLQLCCFHHFPRAQCAVDDRRHVLGDMLADVDRRDCHPHCNQMQRGLS